MDRWDRYTCEETLDRLEDFLDRELSPEEMRGVQAHLDRCASCTSRCEFERQLLGSVREKVRRISLPQDLRDRISRRLDQERRASNG